MPPPDSSSRSDRTPVASVGGVTKQRLGTSGDCRLITVLCCIASLRDTSRRLSSAPGSTISSARNDKRDLQGRLLFAFLMDLSGQRQTSSGRHPTLVVRVTQRPKLLTRCTCRYTRLSSARVATFLLIRVPAI